MMSYSQHRDWKETGKSEGRRAKSWMDGWGCERANHQTTLVHPSQTTTSPPSFSYSHVITNIDGNTTAAAAASIIRVHYISQSVWRAIFAQSLQRPPLRFYIIFEYRELVLITAAAAAASAAFSSVHVCRLYSQWQVHAVRCALLSFITVSPPLSLHNTSSII